MRKEWKRILAGGSGGGAWLRTKAVGNSSGATATTSTGTSASAATGNCGAPLLWSSLRQSARQRFTFFAGASWQEGRLSEAKACAGARTAQSQAAIASAAWVNKSVVSRTRATLAVNRLDMG